PGERTDDREQQYRTEPAGQEERDEYHDERAEEDTLTLATGEPVQQSVGASRRRYASARRLHDDLPLVDRCVRRGLDIVGVELGDPGSAPDSDTVERVPEPDATGTRRPPIDHETISEDEAPSCSSSTGSSCRPTRLRPRTSRSEPRPRSRCWRLVRGTS